MARAFTHYKGYKGKNSEIVHFALREKLNSAGGIKTRTEKSASSFRGFDKSQIVI